LNFLGLIFFAAVAIFVLSFFFKAMAHLFRLFGWIASDVSKAAAKVLEYQPAPEKKEKAEPVESETVAAEEPAGQEIAAVPARKAQVAEKETEVAFQDTETEKGCKKSVREDAKRRTQVDVKENEDTSLVDTLVSAGVAAARIGVRAAVALGVYLRRIPAALKAPFPVRTTLVCAKLFFCYMPMVIFFRVPDVYGYGPIINAAKWLFVVYCGIILLIYFLRVLIPIDLEGIFRFESDGENDSMPGIVKFRTALYTILILAFSAVVLVKLVWLGILILGFFYSLVYFFAFARRGRKGFTFGKFLVSWIIFGVFVTIAIVVFYKGGMFEPVAGMIVAPIILITLVFIQMLWVMSRKYEVSEGFNELPVRRVASWLNLFLMPLAKLAVAIPLFYFVILFASVNSVGFLLGLMAVTLIVVIPARIRKGKAMLVEGRLFLWYMLVVWMSIFYIQSYNRIPPAQSVCDGVCENENIVGVWSMKEYRKHGFLKGALPYDTVFDPEAGAVFITFKNLSGYGSIVRVKPGDGRVVARVTPENDRFPGKVFYPERLCIDRKACRLYSTTKASGNFQLLGLNYSAGGLELRDRIRFAEYETTNCEVSENGDVNIIFLGPPDSHLRFVDAASRQQTGEVHFGKFGYADYFALDEKRDRIIVPSLDPANRFRVYEVSRVGSGSPIVRKRMVAFRFDLPGGMTVHIPVPTLGIALSKSNNMLYFTCPFLRIIFEVDADTFEMKRWKFAGRFPREIAVMEDRGMLVVANYGSGTVDFIDIKSLELRKRLRVGKLVRSIEIEPETGRVFIAAACGVFEIILPDE